MSGSPNSEKNVKLIVLIIVFIIGINGLVTLMAENAYRQMDPESGLYFSLDWRVSIAFTVVAFAVLSVFVAQFGSFGRCFTAFGLLVALKIVFSLSTAAFFYAKISKGDIPAAATSAFYSSLPSAITHILFSFISMLFLKALFIKEKQYESDMPPDIPPFMALRMEEARPKERYVQELTPAGDYKPIDDFMQPEPLPDQPHPKEPEEETVPQPHLSDTETPVSPVPPVPQAKPEESAPEEYFPQTDSEPLQPELKQPESVQTEPEQPEPEQPEKESPFGALNQIEIKLIDLISQLGGDDFTCEEGDLINYSLKIDPIEVISQLGEGRVKVKAEEVLSSLPPSILRFSPAEIGSKLPEGQLALPLDKIMDQLPLEVFKITGQQEPQPVDKDIADPFPDVKAAPQQQEQAAAGIATAEIHQQQSAAATMEGPASAEAAADVQPSHEQSAYDIPEHIHVNLAFVIARLPDGALKINFADLQSSLSIPGKLSIPSHYILPQLKMGRAVLNPDQLFTLFPENSFNLTLEEMAQMLPKGTLELQINEIISQIPQEALHVYYKAEPESVEDEKDLFEEQGRSEQPVSTSDRGDSTLAALPQDEQKIEIPLLGEPILDADEKHAQEAAQAKESINKPLESSPETAALFARFINRQQQEEIESKEAAAEEVSTPEETSSEQQIAPETEPVEEITQPEENIEISSPEIGQEPVEENIEDETIVPEETAAEEEIIVDEETVAEEEPVVAEEDIAAEKPEVAEEIVSDEEAVIGEKTIAEEETAAKEEIPAVEEHIEKEPDSVIEEAEIGSAALEILERINQENPLFETSMKRYCFEDTCIAALTTAGINPQPLVEPLPEMVSSLCLFFNQFQLGKLRNLAMATESGAVHIQFVDSPDSGRWLVLADTQKESSGVLSKFYSNNQPLILELFDSVSDREERFVPQPESETTRQEYHHGQSCIADFEQVEKLGFQHHFTVQQNDGFHIEVMLQEEIHLLDQMPQKFLLLEPLTCYDQFSMLGQARLILLKTDRLEIALSRVADRDEVRVLTVYPATISEGMAALMSARVCSIVEKNF